MSVRKESLGEAATGDNTIKGNSRRQIIHIARVISVEDDAAARRIKVRIPGLDNKKTDEELPYCFPFLPLHINIVPKKNESVKVILYDSKNEDSYREYIGPLVPQMGEFLIESLTDYDAKRGREGYLLDFTKSIKKIPTAEGVYPKEDEISLLGRDNADLIFKPSEVLLRAGKFLPGQPTVRNDINPGYIQIKTFNIGQFEDSGGITSTSNNIYKTFLAKEKASKMRSDINLISNKIFLIGRNDNSPVIKPYLTEKEQYELESKLHPIVYGDILKEFIEKLFNWVKSHKHPYHNRPQNDFESPYLELETWMSKKLPLLNSKNIFAGGDYNVLGEVETSETLDEKPVRINSQEQRVSDLSEPIFEITGSKLCDSTKCRVELNMINKASGDIYKKLSGEGNTQLQAYTQVVNDLIQELTTANIVLSNIKIPLLTELKNF